MERRSILLILKVTEPVIRKITDLALYKLMPAAGF